MGKTNHDADAHWNIVGNKMRELYITGILCKWCCFGGFPLSQHWLKPVRRYFEVGALTLDQIIKKVVTVYSLLQREPRSCFSEVVSANHHLIDRCIRWILDDPTCFGKGATHHFPPSCDKGGGRATVCSEWGLSCRLSPKTGQIFGERNCHILLSWWISSKAHTEKYSDSQTKWSSFDWENHSSPFEA